MSEKSLDLTSTPCTECGQTSTKDEAMIACDGCDRWFHVRCSGLTAVPKKDSKWFCKDTVCQSVFHEYQRRKKTSRTRKIVEEYDKLSSKSSECQPSLMPPTVQDKLKAMEAEQKRLEDEMDAELLLREREIEMKNTLKDRRMKMERELRERELERERLLREKEIEEKEIELKKELREKEEYLMRMKNMETTYLEEIAAIDKQLRNTKYVNKKKSLDATSTEGRSGPLSNVGVLTESNLKLLAQQDDKTSDEDEDSLENGDEKTVTSKRTISLRDDESQNGQTQRHIRPTRAQLTARSGLTKKLPKFSGKPEEWPLFFGAYQASNEACGYSDIENLVRLQDSLKGAALEAVRGQLLLPKSVPKVIAKLRQLYGRPEQLLQSHLDKVRRLDPPRADKLASFIPFGNAVEQLCEHLEAAELTLHLVNPILIQDLVSKLPDSDKRQWVQYKKKKQVVTLRTFTDFVSEIVSDACEANVSFDYRPDTKTAASGKNKPKEKNALYSHNEVHRSISNNEHFEVSTSEFKTQKPCLVCQRVDHRLRFCQDFRDLPYADRMQVVSKHKLCHTCLNEHKGQCRFKIRCNVEDCREQHNPLLHAAANVVSMNAHTRTMNSIIFRMIPMQIYCGEKSLTVLAFLDEGASVTLIENDLANQLGLSGVKEKLTINWTSDISRVEKHSRRMNVWASAADNKNSEKFLLHTVNTVEKLMLPHQTLHADELATQYPHMRNLPISSYDGRPGLMIGINNIHAFAPLEAKIGTTKEPIAVRCKLGWTVYGPRLTGIASPTGFLGYHKGISNEELHDILKCHYALEESVVKVQRESMEDQRARSIMEQTTRRVGNRFETGLLWKTDEVSLPDSYYMALKRLKQLERKLEKSPELYANVRQQIAEYELKGYAHQATEAELSNADRGKVWYLPLNVVVSPKKPGKVRLVWDASASVQGVSLNSQLLKGPDLLVSLVSVIVGFRERKIAFGGDVREMYHQLQIISQDKQAQRFLFRNSSNESPKTYVMDVATFGSTCSPASAQFVKNRNALEYASQYPEAVAAIIDRHYVDDYFDSADTIDEAILRAKQVRYIHEQGGFEIRNWVSNSPEVLSALGEQTPLEPIVFHQDKQKTGERVLGISWDLNLDVFVFSVIHRADFKEYIYDCKRPTKRIVLSCVMGLFDPLGLLSPFTIHGKIIIQHLWRNGCDWDQVIDDQSWSLWKQWTGLFPEVETYQILRCYLGDAMTSSIESIELHVFTDASEHAYGCVAYLRTITNGTIRCSLIMSRSKVAPLKRQSIPRLELMAAVLGARMNQTILETHSLRIDRTVMWTDSRTVLSWLQSDQHRFKQFVAFRVGEILELTKLRNWRWVPTKQNIADVLTKWGHGPPLQNDSEWVRGPTILFQTSDRWPSTTIIEETAEETRGVILFHAVVETETISSWTKLVRVTATVIRFISNCRRRRCGLPILTVATTDQLNTRIQVKHSTEEKPLQREELQKAETILWRQVQFDSYPDEMSALTKNLQRSPGQSHERIEKSSSIYKLSPILDEEGVLRVQGRLETNEGLPFNMRYPIILSGTHDITKKLILHYHTKFGHANRETVLNELRQKFWIPKARIAIRQVMKECVWCKVNRCVPSTPMMAPLPVQRTTSHLRPFSAVGVDYLGPVEVSVGRRKEKRWIVVFTCMAVRAVHLDVVHSLSTESCLMAIRRFSCKRGAPEQIFSDNATCFRGANLSMKRINLECAEKVISSYTAWHFNPPSTPHMGGIWERMVRSVKEALRALDDGRKLTDEILLTSLAEAEDMINTRPLVYVSQEIEDEEAITPNHFLRGIVEHVDNIIEDSVDFGETLRSVYKRSEYLANKMWNRWLKEYLPSLNHRSKWFQEKNSVKVGDLVFVVDGKNRKKWQRAIVQKVIDGVDGRIRQVDVKTADGKVHRRAVVNLALLELQPGKSGVSE